MTNNITVLTYHYINNNIKFFIEFTGFRNQKNKK